METRPTSYEPFDATEARALGEDAWPWLTGSGVLLVLLGVICLGFAGLTTLLTVVAVGVFLCASGFVQVAGAFRTRRAHGPLLYLATGTITLLAGLALLYSPGAGAASLSLIVAGFFLAKGAFRVVVALTTRLPDRISAVANGILTFIVGLLIAAQWPVSAIWALGLLVAVDMIATGATLFLAGREVRRLIEGPAGARA